MTTQYAPESAATSRPVNPAGVPGADPAWHAFVTRVRGQVLRPTYTGYAEEIAAWNLATTHTPAVVVAATCAEDVAVAVRYASTQGLRVAVQATGHGAIVPATGGLLVTTRRLDEVTIDPVAKTARVGAGVKWRRVIDAAAEHGLAPLNGSSSDVGVVGYTLGGGLGPMARTFGFAADHVLAVEVVTADGEIRRVDADHHPELFWALRGGKGNFGIVTAIEFELLPVATLYGGGIIFPAEAAPDVLHEFQRWTRDLPEQANTSIALLRVPDLPEMPDPLRGRFVVHLRYAYVGPSDEGARLVAPMRAAGPSIMDYIADMPYAAVDSIHMDPTDPVPGWERGVLLEELTADAVDSLLAVAGPDVEIPLVAVEIRLLGGAIARQPEHPNAVAGRHGAYTLLALGPMVPGLEQATPAAGEAVIESVQKYIAEGNLVNFLGDATSTAQVQAAWSPADRDWLLRIKAQYDPTAMFSVGHVLTTR